MDIEADSVAGTHRPAEPRTAWIWGGMGLAWLVLAVMNLPDHHVVGALLSEDALGAAPWTCVDEPRIAVTPAGVVESHGPGKEP